MKKNNITLLIYMAADNNLDKAAMKDLESIRKASKGSSINIVVQLDRNTLPNVREGFRYHFKNGEESVERLEEFNSGDSGILKKFIEDASATYSSEKLIVIVWSHGSGIDDKNPYKMWEKEKTPTITRKKLFESIKSPNELNMIGIAYDDTSKDFIDNIELQKALDVSSNIDIIGFDACLMGMFEIAYQLRKQATVMVASQYLEPASGWDYAQIIKELDIAKSSEDIGKQLVNFYGSSDEHGSSDVTQSALSMKMVDTVAEDLDNFAKVLLENIESKEKLKYTILSSQLFDRSDYIDLVDFVKNIQSSLKIELLEPYVDKLLNSLELLILSNYKKGYRMRGANGVSIYFPSVGRLEKETFEMYEKMDFSRDYGNWIELIKWYWK